LFFTVRVGGSSCLQGSRICHDWNRKHFCACSLWSERTAVRISNPDLSPFVWVFCHPTFSDYGKTQAWDSPERTLILLVYDMHTRLSFTKLTLLNKHVNNFLDYETLTLRTLLKGFLMWSNFIFYLELRRYMLQVMCYIIYISNFQF